MSSPLQCSPRAPALRWRHLQPRATLHSSGTKSAAIKCKNIFVFGLGYTSVALGNWLAADGWSVSGTCRTEARVDGLRAKGWVVDCYDPARGVGLTPELREHLGRSPYVLSSVPPLALALYDPALSAQMSLVRPLAAAGRITWFGYLSSTGVYGDWQGEWVDESSPCRQTSSKAIVRQGAEAAWLQMQETHGLPAHVFRLGGIYGPGRSVLDTLLSNPTDLAASRQRRGRQRYTARCHVYDICAVLAASIAQPRPGSVYNVVDDDPAPRGDVMSYARSLIPGAVREDGAAAVPRGDDMSGEAGGMIRPGEETGGSGRHGGGTEGVSDSGGSGSSGGSGDDQRDLGSGRGSGGGEISTAVGVTGGSSGSGVGDGDGGGGSSSRGGARVRGSGDAATAELEEKRVRNSRIVRELGVALQYPTYREGVAAIHRGDYWPLRKEDLALL